MTRIAARTPLAPILGGPRANATQESQLLYGHEADVLEKDGRWLRIRGTDTYEGWIHEGYTEPARETKPLASAWDIDGELSMGCSVRTSQGLTLDLPLGALVGDAHSFSGRVMDLQRRRATFPKAPDAIVASACALFQGTYYQWGGVTPWGADCSGMLQSIFALHGVHLLRDAWQQATMGCEVEGGIEATIPGDLLFFSDREDGHITHVALSMSNKSAVHIALGRGGHHIERFDKPDSYTESLLGRFKFARRILSAD